MSQETIAWIVVALVVAQRLSELILAKRNTAHLMSAEGAFEVGAGHYPVIVLLHTVWLLTMAYTVWQGVAIQWTWLTLFLVLQAGRVWVLATLGRYWTTRIIVVPDAPMVRRGPFRWVRHPNYLIVSGEIAALPLAFGAWEVAVVFSVLNAIVLFVRIRAEEAANADRMDSCTG